MTVFETVEFRIYCVEQYGDEERLLKYSVTLNGPDGKTVRQYDLDSKGAHIHRWVGGRKDKAHIPYNGGIADIATEIANIVVGRL